MDSARDIPASLTRHLEDIDRALRQAAGDLESELDAAVRYTFGWEDSEGRPAQPGGKRIRPALCLLATESCGAPFDVALPGAVAIEFVHNFSLVHDDIQDHDYERHGRPTLWARLGEAQAINTGDFLFTRASKALTQAGGVDAERRIRALGILSDAVAEMIRGQWMDIAFETAASVSLEEYTAMVSGKTGALLGASLEIGAILAGASEETSAGLARWGRAVGLAFQAHDDLLGVWGQPALTGKSVTSDIARKKRSLPIIIAMSDERAAEAVQEEYAPGKATPNVELVLDALSACQARERTEEIARQHGAVASELLEAIDIDPARREELSAVADYVISRER